MDCFGIEKEKFISFSPIKGIFKGNAELINAEMK